FLMVCGPEWCVLTAIAAFLSQLLVRHAAGEWWVSVAASAWIALLFGLVAALARRLLAPRAIRSTADAARFAGLVGAITMGNAAGYVGLYIRAGEVPAGDALRGIARCWFADMNGVLMLTPLLLAPDLRAQWRGLRGRGLEVSAQVVLLATILAVIFALPDNE